MSKKTNALKLARQQKPKPGKLLNKLQRVDRKLQDVVPLSLDAVLGFLFGVGIRPPAQPKALWLCANCRIRVEMLFGCAPAPAFCPQCKQPMRRMGDGVINAEFVEMPKELPPGK